MAKINFHNLKEYFKIAVKNLTTRRVRSWLTTIGIAIGIFLIVSLMSLSQGLKNAVMSQLNMIGKDLVFIMPGGDMMTSLMGGNKLTDEDLNIIKKTEGISEVAAIDYTSVSARYGDSQKSVLLYGANWKESLSILKNDTGWSTAQGRWPTSGKNEVVIGSITASEIFPNIKIGAELNIEGKKFLVVGILNSVGSKQDDSMIGLDMSIFKSVTGERRGAKQAMAKVKSGYSPDVVSEKIKSNLNENRKRQIGQKQTDSSYTVMTSEKTASIVGNVMGLIQAVIIGFASIAIVVGGIGIMNTMFTSVRERTKEIGIMKAIGAKNKTITTIFLIEAGIFGMLGGISGTLLGMLFAKSIELYFQMHPIFYLKAEVGPGLFLFSIAFSFAVGCLSGYFPARSAAKLKPVDALRYE
jgi:putative ABC transport system permease protein